MILKGILPIGSVVLLKDGSKKLMIVGLLQQDAQSGKNWDYAGVVYPEGFLSAKQMHMFNQNQIAQIFALGYQDGEQLNLAERVEAALAPKEEKA